MSGSLTYAALCPATTGKKAWLQLEDGTRFEGLAAGSPGYRLGEVVFSTGMTGYQELLTDPSYSGQILVSTVSHVGNVGVTQRDNESHRCWLQGYAVQDMSSFYSNWRAQKGLPEWLREQEVVAISGLDTRALVRHLRSQGCMRGVLWHEGTLENVEEQLAAWPKMEGSNLVDAVSPAQVQFYGKGEGRPRVVALDCGMKEEMLQLLLAQGFEVVRVPARTTAAQIMEFQPSGVFLSNGPGDPAALPGIVGCVKELMGRVPMFGICLGHQLLGLALGATTYKLKYGHRGCNQPVLHIPSGRVEVTTQNHGFAVDEKSLPGKATLTHKNLNDGTCEGLECAEARAFSVQYHPENAPGPHDSRYLFEKFWSLIGTLQHA